jgi:DNA repair photolyase
MLQRMFELSVRWQAQALDATADGVLPGLARIPGLLRTVRTPEFAGITFHEVRARSVLNSVPAASRLPFRWTVNPYRGCSHACRYCFARGTHAWLELDTGTGFDSEIVVKVNAPDVLARELSRPSWAREHVALGTNTDPYQRAEGRYRLMPGIIAALAGSGTPFSILTKGTLLRRDLAQLATAAQDVSVGLAVSVAIHDENLQQALEPGAPSPRARLDLVRAIRDAGFDCGVLLAPVLPWLTDSTEDLDAAVSQVAAAGATSVTPIALHLRSGAREWFMAWLHRERPDLVDGYERLYSRGAYVPREYSDWLTGRLTPIVARYGLDRVRGGQARRARPDHGVDSGGNPTSAKAPAPAAGAVSDDSPAPDTSALQGSLRPPGEPPEQLALV